MSSIVNLRPPANWENKSSILGIGYLSSGQALLTVFLKSPQILTDW